MEIMYNSFSEVIDMFLNFVPDAYYQNIAEIPYNTLYEQGIRLILTDLDNTLLSYKEDAVSEALLQWNVGISV